MTDPDLLPNGMRLGQRVRVRGGGRLGATVEGEVVAWQQNPTVVIRGADGENRHVIYRAEWEPMADDEGLEPLCTPVLTARRQAFADIVAVLENHDEWSARRVVWSLFASEEGLTS